MWPVHVHDKLHRIDRAHVRQRHTQIGHPLHALIKQYIRRVVRATLGPTYSDPLRRILKLSEMHGNETAHASIFP